MDQNDLDQAMNDFVDTLNDLTARMGGVGPALDNTKKSANELGDAHKTLRAAERKAADDKREAEAARAANQASAYASSIAGFKSLGTAMLDTEKSFGKFGAGLNSLGSAVLDISKNFGGWSLAGGLLFKGATMAADAAFKQADNTLKATDSFSKMGAAGSFTAGEVLDMGHKAGLTSKNIEVLTKATKTLGTSTLSLGGTVSEGVAEFAKMTAVGKEQRMAFQRLGISQEELIQSQADFVSLQKASGVQVTARMKQDGGLQKASLEYTKNLLELAAITGEDLEGAKKLQIEAQSELETKIQTNMMQQRINELQKQGTVESEAQAAALEKELKSRNDVLAVAASTKDAELKSATASFLATGAITEQSVMLKRLIPNIEEFGEKIKKGENVSVQFAEALQKGTDANAKSVGTAGMLDKTVAKTFGLTDGLLTWSAQRRDVDIKAAKDKAGKDLGKPEDGKTGAKTEQDPAQIARNKLTEAEIAAQVVVDKMVAAMNPLLKGFDGLSIMSTVLVGLTGFAGLLIALKAATAALGKMSAGAAGAGGAADIAGTTGKAAKGAGALVKGASVVGAVMGGWEIGSQIGDYLNEKYKLSDKIVDTLMSSTDKELEKSLKGAAAPAAAAVAPQTARDKERQARQGKNQVAEPVAPAAPTSAPTSAPAAPAASPTSAPAATISSADQLKSSGLTIKKGDVQKEGSYIDPRLIEAAKLVQASVPGFMQFTGFNDQFHNENSPTSKHTKGMAFDFVLNKKPSKEDGAKIVSMLSELGLQGIDEYNAPSAKATGGHIHGGLKAYDGGIFNGPIGGYNVELHGREAIVPLPSPNELVKEGSKEAALPGNASANAVDANSIIADLMAMMEEKFDDLIDAIQEGNDTSEELLKVSRV
jgi:hypothetical protein